MTLLLLLSLFSVTAILTWAIRQYAHHKDLLDHPNHRSSHVTPTPKGGGLAIMVTFYSALTYLYIKTQVDEKLFFALLSALPVIFISLIDDIRPLPAKLRFAIQLFSASFALYFLGGVSSMHFGLFTLHGIWLNLVALLGIIWMTNLYNFLDGIDGYAGSEAFFVGLAAYLLFGNESALLIAVATAGFLFFNWHKASIFMGDVGSAPLGFIFAVFILNDAGTPHFLGWLMLLSLFWFDATLTLIRRAGRKEKLSQAHKKHAYQRLNQAGFSHDKVVLLAMCVNAVIFAALYLLPQSAYLYLFFVLLVLLYSLIKFIDTKKAFE
ncbi:MAG: glycosyltransferase family 4 protein [Helicobacteraceae bacterium]|jgi:Fuc2NAc and GlcNAc transferase|nr:glycosyltransferase family 4 protein [Helicobacteraceae bacterium]